jgi:hypothetical protein
MSEIVKTDSPQPVFFKKLRESGGEIIRRNKGPHFIYTDVDKWIRYYPLAMIYGIVS